MAIYHLSAQVLGRSSGRSSVAAAAYRAGEQLHDRRTNVIHDYSRRRDIERSEGSVVVESFYEYEGVRIVRLLKPECWC